MSKDNDKKPIDKDITPKITPVTGNPGRPGQLDINYSDRGYLWVG